MKTYRNKETRELFETIESVYAVDPSTIGLDKKMKFEESEGVVLAEAKPIFFRYENSLVPTLKLLLEYEILKKITVDMGAVRFMTKGADVMRPGIIHIEEGIKERDFVVIVDESHGKPLAVGRALFEGNQMREMDSGKVVDNLHHVGDNIWNSF